MSTQQYLNEIDRQYASLLETLEEPKVRVFCLPDGNERGRQKDAKSYSDGGSKVVQMIETLVRRGDVDLAVFGILSKENVQKRNEEFFEELYVAFFKLALGIEMEGLLLKDGVSLYLEGNLKGLRKRGKSAAKLADMVENVIASTQGVESPKLKIGFGVDYSPTVLMDRKINVLIRTGMEKSGAFRSSGLDLDKGMVCLPTVDLWPNTDIKGLSNCIDQIKSSFPGNFSAHSSSVIRALDDDRIRSRRLALSVICQDDFETAKRTIEGMVGSNREMIERMKIFYMGGGLAGGPQAILNRDDANHTVLLYPRKEISFAVDPARNYAFVLAPGQTDRFVFPAPTPLKYATVIGTGTSVDEIREGIVQGLDFVDKVPSLLGGQREPQRKLSKESEWSEFDYLKSASNQYEGEPRLVEYNKKADAFAQKCLNWCRSRGINFDKSEQMRAMVNYFFTSFFMTNYDNHPDWNLLEEQAHKLGMIVAMYMAITYLFDDRIYDLEMDHEKKVAELDFATDALLGGLGMGGHSMDFRFHKDKETYQVVKSLFLMLGDLVESVAKTAGNSRGAIRWKEKMAALIRSHHNEYFYKHNKSFDGKVLQPVDTQRGHVADFVKGKLANADKAEKLMWNYVLSVEESIGASMTFEVLMASLEGADEMPKPILNKFEDVFSLINIYYRLLNDAAEVFRSSYDQESGEHAVSILQNERNNLVKSTAEVLRLAKQIKAEIQKLRQELLNESKGKPWERLALAVIRSDIAELFYKNTHYRVAKRDKVSAFFEQMYQVGI